MHVPSPYCLRPEKNCNLVLMSTLFCESFSLQACLCQKLKKRTLDGAKSTWNIKKADHWVQ